MGQLIIERKVFRNVLLMSQDYTPIAATDEMIIAVLRGGRTGHRIPYIRLLLPPPCLAGTGSKDHHTELMVVAAERSQVRISHLILSGRVCKRKTDRDSGKVIVSEKGSLLCGNLIQCQCHAGR